MVSWRKHRDNASRGCIKLSSAEDLGIPPRRLCSIQPSAVFLPLHTHTPTWFLAHLLFGGHTTQHRLISCMMPSGLSLTQWGKCAMVYTSSHKKIPQERSPCSLRWNQLIDSTSCRARKGTHPILLAK